MEPTTFAAMKAMERMGFIERRQLPGNRKNMHVYLTDLGRELEGQLVPLAEEVNHISAMCIPERTLSLVKNSLLKMIENLANEEAARAVADNTLAGE